MYLLDLFPTEYYYYTTTLTSSRTGAEIQNFKINYVLVHFSKCTMLNEYALTEHCIIQ